MKTNLIPFRGYPHQLLLKRETLTVVHTEKIAAGFEFSYNNETITVIEVVEERKPK